MQWILSKDRKRWTATPTRFMRFTVVRYWFFGAGFVLWVNGRKIDPEHKSAYEAIRFAERLMDEIRQEIADLPDPDPVKFLRETKIGITEACGLDAC